MNFNYSKICLNLLEDLPRRAADVVERRFGFAGRGGKRETLEAIGESYDITRERVRQIEAEAFSKIKPKIKKCRKVFQHFDNLIASSGGLKKEKILLALLGGDKYQNEVLFLLTLADDFEKYVENEKFYSFWLKEKKALKIAEKVVSLTIKELKKEKKPLKLEELFRNQKKGLLKLNKEINKNVFQSCLEISKNIKENLENQIGLKNWVEINPRGIKDKAYLVLKKQGKPLHFRKVADLISNSPYSAGRQMHSATVHNELIKDQRFVLVGRGLYGLKEWGYEPGVVKEVILRILQKERKPLSKEEIIKQVSRQRVVKANTVVLNLQDKERFFKNSDGRYIIKEN